MKDYSATLSTGEDIYIPAWPVDVQLEDLTRAGKALGATNIINISHINVPSFITALMECEDPKMTAALVTHFVCQARMDGKKILPNTIDTMFAGNLTLVAELFCHIIHSQYHDFFVSGSAKVPSPES